ncbi:MAG: transporter substrate-binding domain-containing protein [Magnetococcales bacterium]|nr:transporter substrate-binding domain-containing protein [Magnetococcales bacterium]
MRLSGTFQIVFIFCVLTAFSVAVRPAFANPDSHTTPSVFLTDQEQAWIAQNPIIRVANETDWPPYDFAEEGIPKGYSIELISLAALKTGLTLNFINGHTWNTLLTMGQERKIDLFPAIWKNEDRLQFLDFTTSYVDTPHILIVRKEETSIHTITDLKGKTLAGVKGYADTQEAKKHFPEITVLETENTSQGLRAVAYGQADAYLGTLGSITYAIRKGMIHGLSIAGETTLDGRLTAGEMHFAARNDWPLLGQIIQKGLNAVSVQELADLQKKWVSLPNQSGSYNVPLMPNEKRWLKNHPILRFSAPSIAMLSIHENNQLHGIIGELLNKAATALHVELSLEPNSEGEPSSKSLLFGQLDFILKLEDTRQNKSFITTQPLVQVPLAIVTRDSVSYVESLDHIGNKIVTVVRPEARKLLSEHLPDEQILLVPDMETGLKLVKKGRAFAFVDLAPVCRQKLISDGDESLKISGLLQQRLGIYLLTRPSNALLVSIMDKAFALLPSDERTKIMQNWAKIQIGTRIDYTLLAWTISIFSLILVVALAWSATLRKQIRQREAAEIRLRSMAHAARDAIIHLDALGRISFWNRAAEQMFGWSRDEAIGREIYTDDFFMADAYRQKAIQGLTLFQETGDGEAFGHFLELNARHQDGRTFPVEMNIGAMRLDGQWNAVGVLRDITERKQMENALRIAKEEAEQANKAKTEFLATMSHEIRTPMNVLLGMIELLSENEHDSEKQHFINVANSSGEVLLTLINDILDLSKIEAGEIILEQSPIETRTLIEDVAHIFTQPAIDKGIHLNTLINANVPQWIGGDPARLRQLLINLTGNALKFTDKGHVTIQLDSPKIETLIISVVDTGIGIPADKLEAIFKPFTQVDTTISRQYGGTGLGLAICRRIVEKMNGYIWADSTEGQGSSFQIELPLKTIKPPIIQDNNTSSSQSIKTDKAALTILMAEDSEDNAMLIQAYLKTAPHQLTIAQDGRIAVELFKKNSFDLVFMDVQMPNMDGYAATREIRTWETQQGLKPTPIYALSAHAFSDAKKHSLAAGCNDHLTKPIKKRELLRFLQKMTTEKTG